MNVKNNLATIIIVLATIILAGVAGFTATKLYELRQQSVAPNAPESKPKAASASCQLTFSIVLPTNSPTPTPTATPTPTPTLTPTPTPAPQCNSSCQTASDCLLGMTCVGNVCRNSACTSSINCICATATPTPTSTPTPTPTPTISPTATPIAPMCSAVYAYDSNWNLLTQSQLNALQPGATISFGVIGSGAFDMARFTINGTLMPNTTTLKPGTTNEYVQNYTLPAGVASFTVQAELHDPVSNQWY